jgi:site-specific recombinase XerC
MWIAAMQPRDPFEKPGLASRWRLDTQRLTEQDYGRYLGWLKERGELDPDARPIDRVDEARVAAFVQDYSAGRAPSTVALAVRGIAYMIRATHAPKGLPWLTKAAHAMVNHAEPVKPKAPRMATMAELLELGVRLMKIGKDELDRGHRRGAQVFRDGLMVCALITRPLRRRNFSALEIGKTLIVGPDAIRVFFSGKETKTHNAIDFLYPRFLRKAFGFYLRHARPVLREAATGADDGMLWVGRRGRWMDGEEIAQRIGNLTRRHLKRRISPHLFRDCVATDIAIHDPAHVGITKSVLGHATLATSQKYYNQAGSFHATRRQQDVVANLRDGG